MDLVRTWYGLGIVALSFVTGDGYFEFETIDVDGNKVEVTAKNN